MINPTDNPAPKNLKPFIKKGVRGFLPQKSARFWLMVSQNELHFSWSDLEN